MANPTKLKKSIAKSKMEELLEDDVQTMEGDEIMEDVEILVDATPQEIVVEDEQEIEVDIAQEVTIDTTEIAKPSKLVRVKPKEKFKCFIGEWYYFEKNRVYSVPEHVKEILMTRDKLLPM